MVKLKTKGMMKKFIYVLTAVLLVLAGCSSEEIVKNGGGKYATLTASIEKDAKASRLVVGDDNALSWTEGDVFDILVGTDTYTYKYQDGIFTAVGNAVPDNTEDEAVAGVVFAGMDNNEAEYNAGTLSVALAASMDLTGNETPENSINLPMWGTWNEGQVSFKHLVGILRVNLNGLPVGYNTLKVVASNPISGDFTADVTVDKPTLMATDEVGSELLIKFNSTQESTSGKSLYLPLPVGTYASIKVSIIKDGENEVVLANWENKTVERATIYTANTEYNQGLTLDNANRLLANSPDGDTKNILVEISESLSNGTVTVPAFPGSNVTLVFSNVEDNATLNVVSATEQSVGQSQQNITLYINSGNSVNLNVNTPVATVSVLSGNLNEITATTALQTLIIGNGVTVSNVEVGGGHVIIEEEAEVTSVVASDENTDVVYVVDKRENSTLSGDDVTVLGSEEELELRVEIENNTTDTYTLTENLVLTVPMEIPSDKSMTIDLNGYNITAGSNGYVLYNQIGGTLRIIDSKDSGEIYGVVYTGTESKTIIDGGIYKAVEGGKYVFLNSSGSLTINNAEVYGGSNYPIFSYNANHQLTIEDVTVHGIFGCVNAYGTGGKVEINGGTFEMTGVEGNTSHIAYFTTNSEVIIKNGTFAKVGDVDLKSEGGGGICAYGGAKLTIEGGTFKCADQGTTYGDVYNYGGTGTAIYIKGGTYLKKPTSLSEGYIAIQNADGTWTVTEE